MCSQAHIVNLQNFVLQFLLVLSPQHSFCSGIRVLMYFYIEKWHSFPSECGQTEVYCMFLGQNLLLIVRTFFLFPQTNMSV